MRLTRSPGSSAEKDGLDVWVKAVAMRGTPVVQAYTGVIRSASAGEWIRSNMAVPQRVPGAGMASA